MEIMKTSIRAILDNIESAEEFLDKESIEKFESIIINSNNIFVTGAGRSGLAAKAFAMRLMHLGLSAYVVGETISPAIYADDCIVAISGSGETNTIVSAANIAKNRGSKVLALTSYPESTLGQLADCFILVKGRTKKEVDDDSRKLHFPDSIGNRFRADHTRVFGCNRFRAYGKDAANRKRFEGKTHSFRIVSCFDCYRYCSVGPLKSRPM